MWSIWEQRHFLGDADLLVVGAGITGLLTALVHKRKHPAHRVRVLERGPHPSGATARNAGFSCFGSPSELLADMEAEGSDAALARVEERWKGACELRAELGDAGLGFDSCGGYEYFPADSPLYTRVADRLASLNAALSSIFGGEVFRLDPQGLERNGLPTTGNLIGNDLEGAIDSGALLSTLLRKVRNEGVEVLFGQEVSAWEETSGRVRLSLSNGQVWHSARLVLATNGFTSALVPDAGIRPARGQVILTQPIPGLKLRGTFHVDEGYIYFRHLDGAVLLGGARNADPEGETTAEHGPNEPVLEALRSFLREHILPGREAPIAMRWSGIMGFPENGKEPIIRRLGERVVLAAGLSGMGVALGIRVARRAAGLL